MLRQCDEMELTLRTSNNPERHVSVLMFAEHAYEEPVGTGPTSIAVPSTTLNHAHMHQSEHLWSGRYAGSTLQIPNVLKLLQHILKPGMGVAALWVANYEEQPDGNLEECYSSSASLVLFDEEGEAMGSLLLAEYKGGLSDESHVLK